MINPKNDPDGWIDAMTTDEAMAFMEAPVETEVYMHNGKPVHRRVLPLTFAQLDRIAKKAGYWG